MTAPGALRPSVNHPRFPARPPAHMPHAHPAPWPVTHHANANLVGGDAEQLVYAGARGGNHNVGHRAHAYAGDEERRRVQAAALAVASTQNTPPE